MQLTEQMKKLLLGFIFSLLMNTNLYSQATIACSECIQINCGKYHNMNMLPITMETNHTICNNKLYFGAYDVIHGYELWVSDGTYNGTFMIKDICTVEDSYTSLPGAPQNINGNSLYFNLNSVPTKLTGYNNKLYFIAKDGYSNYSYWESDGTAQGTILANNVAGIPFVNAFNFITYNNKTYFTASDVNHGNELWVSDSTVNGTMMVKDINPGISNSYISNLIVCNNKLFFTANNGINGNELWVSNGTSSGTEMLKDFNSGVINSEFYSFAIFNNKLYFYTDDGINGRELWSSDGTSNGTSMVKDIYSGLSSSQPKNYTPSMIVIINNKLYFSATDGINGSELWESDGTFNGTIMIKDIYPGSASGVMITGGGSTFSIYNNKMYFRANDGINGNELWMSDGTSDGTLMVKDIQPGSSSSQVYPLVTAILNDKLYFGANYFELWETDGTSSGTVNVLNNSSCRVAFPFTQLTVYNNKLYFAGSATGGSFQLWSYEPVVTEVNETNHLLSNISIYPNPANGKITIDLSDSNTPTATIKLMNIMGETILVEQTNESKSQLDLSSVPNGIYLIQVQTNNSTSTNRIVVQK